MFGLENAAAVLDGLCVGTINSMSNGSFLATVLLNCGLRKIWLLLPESG
jgi:hypothetical protein